MLSHEDSCEMFLQFSKFVSIITVKVKKDSCPCLPIWLYVVKSIFVQFSPVQFFDLHRARSSAVTKTNLCSSDDWQGAMHWVSLFASINGKYNDEEMLLEIEHRYKADTSLRLPAEFHLFLCTGALFNENTPLK